MLVNLYRVLAIDDETLTRIESPHAVVTDGRIEITDDKVEEAISKLCS